MGESSRELGVTGLANYASQGWSFVPGFFSADESAQLVRFTEEMSELDRKSVV